MSKAQPIAALFDMSKATPIAAPAVSKPNVTPQSLPETDLEQFAAHRIDNLAKAPGQVYAGLKDTVPKIANDVYDVSAPGIATEVYKAIKGQANKLKDLPPKMIMAWLAAGGLPEADTAELSAGKAATETAAKTASESAPAEAAPIAAKAPIVAQPPVAAAPPATPAPVAPPVDPLLERLKAFAAQIEDDEAVAPKVRRVTTRTKVRTPSTDEDLTPLLQESLRRVRTLRELQ